MERGGIALFAMGRAHLGAQLGVGTGHWVEEGGPTKTGPATHRREDTPATPNGFPSLPLAILDKFHI